MGKLLRLPTNEQKLVRQCLKGDSRAQRELYDRFCGQMLGVCRRYVKTIEDAEEVLSNAFIKVFSWLDQFKAEGNLGGWIRRILSHESLNDQCEAEHLMMMIYELPLGYRTVFNLYAVEGYSHKEIGDMLDISENTSKSQLSKARKALRDKLDKNELLYKEQWKKKTRLTSSLKENFNTKR